MHLQGKLKQNRELRRIGGVMRPAADLGGQARANDR
jgi:hypothetical protein